MNDHYVDNSHSGSEEESALTGRENRRKSSNSGQSTQQIAPHADGASTDRQDESDELMLSEFLISLHRSSGYQAHAAAAPMDMVQTVGYPSGGYAAGGGGYTHTHHTHHHITTSTTVSKGPGGSSSRSTASRRTVVHRRKRRDDLAGPCNHCGALTSPQWRKGPKGKPVLCNACGIRFLRNRTLTKVMPKTRRHGAGAKRSRAAALAAAAAMEGDDDAADDDDLMAAAADEDDEEEMHLEEAFSAAAPGQHYQTDLLHQQLLLQHCREQQQPSPAEAALLCSLKHASHTQADTSAHQQLLAALEQAYQPAAGTGAAADHQGRASAAGHADHPSLFVAGLAAAAGGASSPQRQGPTPAAAAVAAECEPACGGSSGSRSLLAHLGDCPSLTLALALHQQQQQRRQHEEQNNLDSFGRSAGGVGSKYSLPQVPELQLCPPHSPPAGDSSATGFTYTTAADSVAHSALLAAAAAAKGSASPLSSASSLLQLQQQYSNGSSPPLSPLFLRSAGAPQAGSGNGGRAGVLPSLQLPGASVAAPSGRALSELSNDAAGGVAAAAAGGSVSPTSGGAESADILQLVQQLGSALGGVGPAVEFLKLCSGNPAAVAAAVAAVAASAAMNAAL